MLFSLFSLKCPSVAIFSSFANITRAPVNMQPTTTRTIIPFCFVFVLLTQTQPVPNPISYFLHHSPWWFHRFETLSNHFIELVVPFFTFMGRRMCMINGVLQILFQVRNMYIHIYKPAHSTESDF